MKVLVIGGGGREHALAWKLAQSPQVSEVISHSDNPGIGQVARRAGAPGAGIEELAALAEAEGVDLTVVGPEAYLDLGIVDAFRARGLRIVGPTRSAAQIESSKAFAKELMAKAGVPTARFFVCESPSAALQAVRRFGAPVVVKADGLAGGKGVTVALTLAEAEEAVDRIMVERRFGEAGERVVVEEFLEGEEASVLAFADGENARQMPAAQDHKRAGAGDTGPNTGGMGAYSPAPVVTPEVAARVQREILEPTVRAMAAEGRPYQGILYAGLMITRSGPVVVEFNCRFGDPEAQAVLPRMKSDLVEPLLATLGGGVRDVEIEWDARAAACVVMASAGYPGEYRTGLEISGVEEAEALEDVWVFHAGTRREGGRLLTAGGRVLCVTALGGSVREAVERAYLAVGKIRFEGAYYRPDIGARALGRTQGR